LSESLTKKHMKSANYQLHAQLQGGAHLLLPS